MKNEKLRNLLIRTLSGSVFIALMFAGMMISMWSFALLLSVIAAGCLWEFYSMAGKSGSKPYKWAGIAITLAAVGSSVSHTANQACPGRGFGLLHDGLWMLVAVLVFGVFFAEVLRGAKQKTESKDSLAKQTPDNVFSNLGTTFVGVVYVGIPAVVLWSIPSLCNGGWTGTTIADAARDAVNYFPLLKTQPETCWSPILVMVFMVTVWANDVFAYLTGSLLGKHPMSPGISPKKSWEGFFGGVAGAVGVSILLGSVVLGGDIRFWLFSGVVIAVCAVAGDLVESYMKRTAGIKDSGSLMPGHGGMLDRFDAVLFSAPFFFVILKAQLAISAWLAPAVPF